MQRGTLITDSLLTPKKTIDTLSKPKNKPKYDYSNHNPRKAALRSLVLPGWGQIYNRTYTRLPLVYGGLLLAAVGFRWNGLTTGYYWNNQVYKDYRTAYEFAYIGDEPNLGIVRDLNIKHYPIASTLKRQAIYSGQFMPETTVANVLDSEGKPRLLTIDQITRGKDFYRRNRDLSVIIFLGVWVLNAIEANVSAHLLTFPTEQKMEDLSLNLEPYMESGGIGGNVIGSKIVLKF